MHVLKTKILPLFILAFLVLNIQSCKFTDDVTAAEEAETSGKETYSDSTFVIKDWTSDSHSNKATPNFDLIFNDSKVQRLDIVITKSRWQMMLDDMTAKYGTFGRTSGQGAGLAEVEDAIFVPAEVFYEGKQWYKVGVRFKGNSSLQTTWQSGNLKLSFKLDFDEFEDQYPKIDNQRFYGFKKMSLKNNFNDPAFVREKVAGDVFRNAGLAGSHTAFYTVYVDNGDGKGAQYFGLYTLTEEVDDTVISTQFTSKKGNLYKPDGAAATFANGSFNKDQLVKKTNEDEADYTDVQNLLSVLHASNRTSDAATWRKNLDAIFDTEVFLKYLAVNTTVQNWDTYGRMTHNYFLYNNPATSKLTWIPWDNNEALQTGKQGGSLPLNFSGLTDASWPIIGYLYKDAVYKAKYDAYLKEVINGPFKTATMQTLYDKYSTLINSYATSERTGYTFLRSSSEFSSGISTLKTHVSGRQSAVESYLK